MVLTDTVEKLSRQEFGDSVSLQCKMDGIWQDTVSGGYIVDTNIRPDILKVCEKTFVFTDSTRQQGLYSEQHFVVLNKKDGINILSWLYNEFLSVRYEELSERTKVKKEHVPYPIWERTQQSTAQSFLAKHRPDVLHKFPLPNRRPGGIPIFDAEAARKYSSCGFFTYYSYGEGLTPDQIKMYIMEKICYAAWNGETNTDFLLVPKYDEHVKCPYILNRYRDELYETIDVFQIRKWLEKLGYVVTFYIASANGYGVPLDFRFKIRWDNMPKLTKARLLEEQRENDREMSERLSNIHF